MFLRHFAELQVLGSDDGHHRVIFLAASAATSEQSGDLSVANRLIHCNNAAINASVVTSAKEVM